MTIQRDQGGKKVGPDIECDGWFSAVDRSATQRPAKPSWPPLILPTPSECRIPMAAGLATTHCH